MNFSVAISLLYVEMKEQVLKMIFSELMKNLWSEWEIRFMTMLSLLLQYLLVYFGRVRKQYTGPWVPVIAIIAWLVYFSADWTATLVLSTLLRGSSIVEQRLVVFWTPFLLWHLGGPYNITAYSLEDNKLWLRYFMAMFFQIGEAIYITVQFQTNSELNYMAIPLFIAGVVKYAEKIWALRYASPKQLMKCFYSSSKKPGNFKSEAEDMIRTGLFDSLERKNFIVDQMITDEVKFLREVHSSFEVLKPLFTDLPFQISKRFHDEMIYLKTKSGTRTAAEAFNFVKIELGFLYDLLFTKKPLQQNHYIWGLVFRSIYFFSVLSVLIAFSVRYPIIQAPTADIVITYMLLFNALFLEFNSFRLYIRSKWTMLWHVHAKDKLHRLYLWFVGDRLRSIKSWEGVHNMGQHDLLDYYVKAKTSKITRALKVIDFNNLLQRFWYTKWKKVDIELKKFIYDHLKKKHSEWEEKGFDSDYLKEMLGEKGDDGLAMIVFDAIVKEDWKPSIPDFCRQIFIWHIATSLVYYDDLSKHGRDATDRYREIGKSLSDYMMYLVLVLPIMLPKGFSDKVNDETYSQTTRIVIQPKTKQTAMKVFVETLGSLYSHSLVANKFSEFGAFWEGIETWRKLQMLVSGERWDNEEKWKMISERWMLMMVHAASRCTWEEHAQQLRHGSELLTHVALIMAHLGLSTQVYPFEKSDDSNYVPDPF